MLVLDDRPTDNSYVWFGSLVDDYSNFHRLVHIYTYTLYTACSVAHAQTYGSGCEVSSCDTGWSASVDRTDCTANTCSCPNGVASSGAKCPSEGAERCISCDSGFKLDALGHNCTGTFMGLYIGGYNDLGGVYI